MIVRSWIRSGAGCAAMFVLAGCGGLLETTIPPPQTYVLRLAPPPAAAAAGAGARSVLVQRPEAGPGLDSDRIILLRSERRFDAFAASRWAAPAPDMVESMIVDALRAGGAFAAVFDDSAPYPPHYTLRVTLRRFEADYSTDGNGGGGRGPMVHVTLDATLGRHRDRALLASFTAQGSVQADEDRMGAVVAAFGAAATTAVNELAREAAAAAANDPPVAVEARK
jgi:cholesterol transport system auxiliary component